MQVDVLKIDGSLSDEKIELSDKVFGIEPNNHVVYLAVKAYLANQRQGTSKAKERAEVRGGGKKPWKQKGRGGSRAGTSRSPLWVGGGTIFGPRPRDHRQDLPKRVKQLSKYSALSSKVKDEQLVVVEDFNFDTPKSKSFSEVMNGLKVSGKKVLLLTSTYNQNVYKSGRNLSRVQILEASKASAYDMLNNQVLVLQKGAVKYFNSLRDGIKHEEVENA